MKILQKRITTYFKTLFSMKRIATYFYASWKFRKINAVCTMTPFGCYSESCRISTLHCLKKYWKNENFKYRRLFFLSIRACMKRTVFPCFRLHLEYIILTNRRQHFNNKTHLQENDSADNSNALVFFQNNIRDKQTSQRYKNVFDSNDQVCMPSLVFLVYIY